MCAAAPLTPDEFAATLDRIGGFERRPFLALAVSGGPDSMALAILAAQWARDRGGGVRALTVDHDLRPESAAEARQVGAWLGARGIAHETLVWTGDKPRTGVQEAARAARYRLLAGWCAANGILHLMTAHQRDDQAETWLIRRRAGSGVDGLAGMPAVRELPGCRLVRPLLAVPRQRLAPLLAAAGQPFLDDPSNRSPRFERGRLRAESVAVEAAIAETRRCAAARIEREGELDGFLARTAILHPAGFAAIEAGALSEAAPELAERLLSRVAACIGGLHYPARRERVARLRAGLVADPDRGRTLGGCRFLPWRGYVLVIRELAAAQAPVHLAPGEAVRWDQRFLACASPMLRAPITLGYLGQYRRVRETDCNTSRSAGVSRARRTEACGGDGRAPETVAHRTESDTLPPLLHAVLPAIWNESGALLEPVEAQTARLGFRPANPLTDAGYAVV